MKTRCLFPLAAFALWCSLPVASAQAAPTGAAPASKPVPGFADLHNHLFAELAFGGAWLHGNVSGPELEALAGCDGGDDHARVRIPLVSRFIGATAGSTGDTGSHSGKKSGFPDYQGWPRWDTIAHQQVWSGWLKQAHEKGLNLLVVSAVNFEPLCQLMPEKNRKFDCKDMPAVDRQLDAVDKLVKSEPWMEIALSAKHAREIIGRGHLALVLSFEVSSPFPETDWKSSLDRYYGRGLRTLQLAHQLNDRFAGAAVHNYTFRVFQWIADIRSGSFLNWLHPWSYGFKTDSATRNQLGLTEDGKELVREMMRRGMLVDMAHLSEQTVKDIIQLSESNHDYPLYISHGHFKEMMDDGKFSVYEKSSLRWVLEAVKKSGGIFGLRTGPEKTKGYAKSPVPNDCQGSSKSFAQTYQYGVKDVGVPVAFATDMNGFIQQTRPRFGNSEETCGAERNKAERTRQQLAQKNTLGTPFDQTGLGKISQLGDLMTELKNFGVDTSPLESSAESFLVMWEKADRLAVAKLK